MMATLQLVLFIALGSQFCEAQQQSVCYVSVNQQRTYSSFVKQSSTTYYQCWWLRCSRTRYYQLSVIRYQTEYYSQPVCCEGYKHCNTGCCPICHSTCESWQVCTAPNICSCPPGFTGDMCAEPLCNDCDSNHTCIAADTCVCPTGFTGNDCHIDINECESNAAGCEHGCTNFDGGYSCTCEDGYALSHDLRSCLGAPRNISFTAPTSTTLLLRWQPPEEDPGDGTILHYSIVCRFGDGDSLPPFNSSASSQSLQLTDLHPFTNYNCCVSAQRTNGDSPESCSSETTAEDVPEDFPSNLVLTNISSYAILIEWSPPNIPNGVITAYTIYIDVNEEADRIAVTNGSTSHFTLEDLLPFQLVTVEMTANTSVGEGPKSGPTQVRTNPIALSTAPWSLTVDPQSFSFSWSPPNFTDQNGVVTKYTVTITEVENGRKVQQFDVNSTATSVALRDLILIPCYTYRFSVAAYTVEYGPTATFDMTPTARNSTTLLCFQLVNEEVGTEDTSDYIEELSQIITTRVFLNMTLDGHIRDIIFTNISTPTGDGSETVLMVFLQFRNGTLSRGIKEALSCWLVETSNINISGASLPLIDPPTCLPQYEHTECLQLQSSNGDCGVNDTHDRDIIIILSVVGGVVGALILLFLIVGIVALVTRAKRRHKQTSIPPAEPEKLCHNPLYGEQTKTYVDNPSYETLTTLKQPESQREDESEYMYADPKSSRLHELVSVPFAAPSESEPNHCEDSGQEPQYAKLKLTDAVYKNIEHSDSEIAQENFYSHLDHRTGNLS